MADIYILHEHDRWTAPLIAALTERGLPYRDWHLDKGTWDLTRPPPEGVFYNRMSASSHTRGHRYAPELTSCVLAWLEGHGRRVLNTSRALQLEINKLAQYAALEALGIRTPRTIAGVGREAIMEAARRMDGPFVTKHNRAGSGLGLRLFRSLEALERYLDGPEFEDSVDGITLVQEYIEAPEPYITRLEFVGRRFLYAVRVDTSQGFELCPADVCRVDDAFCPAVEEAQPLFRIVEGFEHPLIRRYQGFLEANGIHIAGVEFIVDGRGETYTYDVNTNTNYNSEAEAAAGVSGMGATAAYLGEELAGLDSARAGRKRAAAS